MATHAVISKISEESFIGCSIEVKPPVTFAGKVFLENLGATVLTSELSEAETSYILIAEGMYENFIGRKDFNETRLGGAVLQISHQL